MATGTAIYLGVVSELVTSTISWMGDFLEFITTNSFVLMFVLLGLVTLGLSVLRRFF